MEKVTPLDLEHRLSSHDDLRQARRVPGLKRLDTPSSFTFSLPQLNPVAFRISNPREAAVIGVLNLLYRHSFATKLCQQPRQIGYPVIDHHRRRRGTEIGCVGGEESPSRVANAIGVLLVSPDKIG